MFIMAVVVAVVVEVLIMVMLLHSVGWVAEEMVAMLPKAQSMVLLILAAVEEAVRMGMYMMVLLVVREL